jgi:thymidylate synthase (FAD)
LKIELLDFTPVKVVAVATAEPYQSNASERLVRKVWDSGHRSVARHGMAVFKVTDVSQSLLRQLSRHPHINLTVKSSRYCDMSEAPVVIPPFIEDKDIDDYIQDYELTRTFYREWVHRPGYTKEQGRELAKLHLSLGSTTDLVVSGNYQALYEFIQLRLCVRAEWEIRKLAEGMATILKDCMPAIFSELGCIGDEWGKCPESHGNCGKYHLKRSKTTA